MKEIEQLLETMLERQERMSRKLVELLSKVQELNGALSEVSDLIRDNPNDMELGKELRKLYNNKN